MTWFAVTWSTVIGLTVLRSTVTGSIVIGSIQSIDHQLEKVMTLISEILTCSAKVNASEVEIYSTGLPSDVFTPII